jgi:hypothetical protein
MEQNQNSIEQEISLLFEAAIAKLDRLQVQTNKAKREIVQSLAKDLEGKVPQESICIEIVTQLRGRVSSRFIWECLDEKYKQKYRVENAKKQKNHNKRTYKHLTPSRGQMLIWHLLRVPYEPVSSSA